MLRTLGVDPPGLSQGQGHTHDSCSFPFSVQHNIIALYLLHHHVTLWVPDILKG